MLHVVTIFAIAPDSESQSNFARALRIGGDWHTRARRVVPNLVAADLLRHKSGPLYICNDIWTNYTAYSRAYESSAFRQLLRERRQMAIDAYEMGPFSAPDIREYRNILEFRQRGNDGSSINSNTFSAAQL